MKCTTTTIALLAAIPSCYAWGPGGGGGLYSYGGGDSTSSNSNSNSNSDSYTSVGYHHNNGGGGGPFGLEDSFSSHHKKLVAHAVLACVAFAFLFPAGGILIRLANFRGLWVVHGLFQLFAYFTYAAAFGLGVYLVRNSPRGTLRDPHPIIGIILLGLVFFQPFFGLLHHVLFKKHLRRTVWSYAHLWLGRIIVTLGIINGGLGLRLARRMMPVGMMGTPSRGAIIGYGVAAGCMWLLYVSAVIVGEIRRSRVRETAVLATGAGEKGYESSKSSSHDGDGGEEEAGRGRYA